MSLDKTLAMILAGGEGRRLAPLTQERSKPAVPFGGRYRIIDFVLCNFANSGVLRMKVLTQYKSRVAQHAHLARLAAQPMLGQFVESVPAQQRTGPEWYQGLGRRHLPEPEPRHRRGAGLRLRLRRRPHLPHGRAADARLPHRSTKADCTVAAIPVPIEEAQLSSASSRRRERADGRLPGEAEEPQADDRQPAARRSPRWATTSSPPRRWCGRSSATRARRARTTSASRSSARCTGAPGSRCTTSPPTRCRARSRTRRGYWRDVGDLDTYYESQHGPGRRWTPSFSLYNTRWPIYTAPAHTAAPAKFVFADEEEGRVGTRHRLAGVARAASSPAAASTARSLSAERARNSYADVEDEHPLRRREGRAARAHPPRHHRQERGDPAGRWRSATTPRRTGSASSSARRASSSFPRECGSAAEQRSKWPAPFFSGTCTSPNIATR